jgi:hypothetical protein
MLSKNFSTFLQSVNQQASRSPKAALTIARVKLMQLPPVTKAEFLLDSSMDWFEHTGSAGTASYFGLEKIARATFKGNPGETFLEWHKIAKPLAGVPPELAHSHPEKGFVSETLNGKMIHDFYAPCDYANHLASQNPRFNHYRLNRFFQRDQRTNIFTPIGTGPLIKLSSVAVPTGHSFILPPQPIHTVRPITGTITCILFPLKTGHQQIVVAPENYNFTPGKPLEEPLSPGGSLQSVLSIINKA